MKGSLAGVALRVRLDERRAVAEEIPESLYRAYMGGRGLNVRRLYEEVPPGADPLGPENKLFFGVGPLNGTLFPGQRFNVSGKSPHTGILGDSNAGGFFGTELRLAGFDQVILEGVSERPVWLLIDNGRVEFHDADELWGLDVWQTHAALRRLVGDGSLQVACIGPAAENGVSFSGIFANLVRACARTGMGRVMAAKRVKALAVRGSQGRVGVFDAEGFRRLMARIDEDIRNHPDFPSRKVLGTTRLVSALNALGMLGTQNHRTGYFDRAEQVCGERLAREFNVKQKACFACTIPCSRFFVVRHGPHAGLRGEGPEFEALAGFTSRILNDDLPLALKCVDLCNRFGVDAISASACISFAMECYERGIISRSEADGLDLRWGNGEAAWRLLNMIVRREGFGAIFADGVKKAAERIGRGSEAYAMEGKGLEVFLGEPRGIKAYGLGLAVASRGADHLRAEPFFELLDDPELGRERFGVPESALRLEYRGKGRVVKYFEDWCAVCDSLDVCKNTVVCMEVLPFERAAELVYYATGLDFDAAELQRVGERIVNTERLFNTREGVRREHDRLPRRFLEEPLPPECGASAGSVLELEPMLDEYYEQRGWEVSTGLPRQSRLAELGLEEEVRELQRLGIRLPV